MNLVALRVPARRHSGVAFEGANLSGWTLSGANLAGRMLAQTKGIAIDGIAGGANCSPA